MSNYQQRWNMLYEQQQQMLGEAKKYILENYQKVHSWYGCFLHVYNGNNWDNSNKRRFGYYSKDLYDPTNPLSIDGQGTIHTLEVVYDPSDTDMSLTITNTQGETLEWWWIDQQAVIMLAHYIEQTLTSYHTEL